MYNNRPPTTPPSKATPSFFCQKPSEASLSIQKSVLVSAVISSQIAIVFILFFFSRKKRGRHFACEFCHPLGVSPLVVVPGVDLPRVRKREGGGREGGVGWAGVEEPIRRHTWTRQEEGRGGEEGDHAPKLLILFLVWVSWTK